MVLIVVRVVPFLLTRLSTEVEGVREEDDEVFVAVVVPVVLDDPDVPEVPEVPEFLDELVVLVVPVEPVLVVSAGVFSAATATRSCPELRTPRLEGVALEEALIVSTTRLSNDCSG